MYASISLDQFVIVRVDLSILRLLLRVTSL